MFEGLVSGILGEVQGRNPMVAAALQVLQQNGGLQGLLQRAQSAGYGQEVQSWIGHGQNLPIDGSAITSVLGSGALAQIASQLGISQDQLAGGLAHALPQVVDKTTPDGVIPDNHDSLISQALAVLTGKPC